MTPTTSDATRCKVCGGPFSAKRIIIEGDQYHEACALMSYSPHTHADYARLSDFCASLKARIEELEDALRPFAGTKRPELRRTLIDFISPMELAMVKAARALKAKP